VPSAGASSIDVSAAFATDASAGASRVDPSVVSGDFRSWMPRHPTIAMAVTTATIGRGIFRNVAGMECSRGKGRRLP
jgi:hypothetical protein